MASPSPSPAPSAGPPKLVNLYHARTVGTAKSCFICHKETTCCLATDGVTDFIYVCRSHLLDPGFAKPAASSAAPSATSSPTTSAPPSPVPQAEIDGVKKEYEEKQAKKAAASSATEEKKDDSTSKSLPSTAFSLLRTGASTLTSLSSTAATTLFPPPPPTVPSATERLRAEAEKAKVFVLQRDYFAMRVSAKRREWEKKDAKERAAGWSFPKPPTGKIG
ncbi:hypothetical protein JCM8097_001046 [Rhodosporidiobolus ruineniae]